MTLLGSIGANGITNKSNSDMEKIDQILESLYDRVIEPMEAKEQLLDLFNVSNSVKIVLLEQLEELSEHIPCEVYTKKVIEIKSNFNDC